jgi:cytochrome P450 family 110
VSIPVVDALALARDPEGFLERRASGSDPFTLRLPGVGEIVLTGTPEGAREVFSAPADTFEPLTDNPVEPLLGRHSLILLGGERHRRERALMMPAFHGDRMRAYGEVFRTLTLAEIARWQSGARIAIGSIAKRITLEAIIRAVFGVQDDARTEHFRRVIERALDAYTAPLAVLPVLRRRFGGMGPWARFERARSELLLLLAGEIDARRATGTKGREDILSLLLDAKYDDGASLSREELVSELCTLLVAGHETTATALVWALAYAHADERILAAVEQEQRSIDHKLDPRQLAALPYLDALCSEALRVHPVVPIAVRRALRPFRLRGVDIPAGGVLAVATTLLHTNKAVFPEPSRFRPERFLERRFSPFEYAPFGGGARRCLGAAFAMYEMKIVLGSIFGRARFAPAPAPALRPVLRNITMGPPDPIVLEYLGAAG